jgi:hypothetical protein
MLRILKALCGRIRSIDDTAKIFVNFLRLGLPVGGEHGWWLLMLQSYF